MIPKGQTTDSIAVSAPPMARYDVPCAEPPLPKRVVVVDDSRTMRSWLRRLIGTDPRLKVVGEACDAQEARTIIKATNPDVITLDIEMPGMNGLEFLERLITLRPMPVVMVSSLTSRGSDAAIKALTLGAVDCIVKPDTALDKNDRKILTQRVFSAACSKILAPPTNPVFPHKAASDTNVQTEGQLVLLGASTGGVAALQTVLSGLDPKGAPVIIVQHMPAPYLLSFCARLNKILPQDVGLLKPGMRISNGQIGIAPSLGTHSVVSNSADDWLVNAAPRQAGDLHCPSVDALFHSAVEKATKVTAALLTGLGRDGAIGLKALRNAGAHTIAQDRSSSVVYGMPRAAFELDAAIDQLPLNDIAGAINAATAAKDQQHGNIP